MITILQVNPCPGIDEDDASPLLINNGGVLVKVPKNNSSLSLHSKIVDVVFDGEERGKKSGNKDKESKEEAENELQEKESEKEKEEANDTVNELPPKKTTKALLRNMSREELEEKLRESSNDEQRKNFFASGAGGAKRKR